ncbi:MAG: hypothetical protein WC614_07220 [bacterium]
MNRLIGTLSLLGLFFTNIFAEDELKTSNNPDISFTYEKGFIGVLGHIIQFGIDGSEINYVKEAGQDVLLPYERYTAEINFKEKHSLIFLAQPFDLLTTEILRRDIMIDSLLFPKGTIVDFKYGFTFYRISYLYDFKNGDKEFSLGASFQIRNADISFTSKDKSLLKRNSNIGPVPILKFRGKIPFKNIYWVGAELDGFYASGKYITGSKNDFEGAILDCSIQSGVNLNKHLQTFLNARYIGGGAKGNENNPDRPGGGYTNNWLKTLALSVGLTYKP